MKIVLDTNVAISALLWEGICNQLLRYLIKYNFRILASHPTIKEFEDVIRYKKFKSRLENLKFKPIEAVAYYENLVTFTPITTRYCAKIEDPDDIKFLDLALSGKASLIISGDNHLLKLKAIEQIPIVMPNEALEVIVRLVSE